MFATAYKVETIGDAYMVASGLPTVYERHAREMSLLALELRESVKHHVIQHLPEEKTQLRIGLHTGSMTLKRRSHCAQYCAVKAYCTAAAAQYCAVLRSTARSVNAP